MAKKKHKHVHPIAVRKHKVIRKSCKKCLRKHTKNEERHHGIGSYCKYHRNTPSGKKNCK